MKREVKTWHIFCYILAIVLVFIAIKAAFGDDIDQKLSRAKQIQIMKQCYIDTKIVIDDGRVKSTEMAITFFYYRTGMIPIAQ